jgi:hypothetical protein
MPLGLDHIPGATGLGPHQALSVGWQPASQTNLMMLIGAFLVILVVLIVLGILGWQGDSAGGNGGGGGQGRPPERDRPPSGGVRLSGGEPQAGVSETDFAEWQRQLETADDTAAGDRERVPAGR